MMQLRQMEAIAHDLGARMPSRVDFADLDYLKEYHAKDQKPALARAMAEGPVNADSIYYHDSKPPFQTADFTAVTLSTTSKAMWPVLGNTDLPTGGYWWPGKRLHVWAFGKFTTAATPGNLTVELRMAQADALGVILATSSAVALTASKTNISWWFEGRIECRATGTAGSFFASGKFLSNQLGLLIPAANNPMVIPESAAVASTVDTTLAANAGISLQFKRSGSTAETATVQDLLLSAMN